MTKTNKIQCVQRYVAFSFSWNSENSYLEPNQPNKECTNNIKKEYVKQLKYGDTQGKCLNVVALGRMSTMIKRIVPSLAYLEQIRQHMAYLRSAVFSFLEISGFCDYTMAQQATLFCSIKSLFMNKLLYLHLMHFLRKTRSWL